MLVSTILKFNPSLVAPKSKTSGNPYKKISNMGHGCRVWSEKSLQNFYWLCDLGLALCDEYQNRYGKRHYCKNVIQWCEDNIRELPNIGLTDFYLAMPEELWSDDPVESYRNYYLQEKRDISKWKYSLTPEWWK